MSLFQSEYDVRVSFEDLDPMNVVWHGNYIRYMEQARCDMLSKLNYTYFDMKDDGVAYPVAKMNVKYVKPALLGDLLTIRVEIKSIEPTLNMNYTIFNKETNEKIFQASTMQIAYDINTKETFYSAPERLTKLINEVRNEKNN